MTEQHPVNLEARPAISLHDDARLLEMIAKTPEHKVTRFTTSGRDFRVILIGRDLIKDMSNIIFDVQVDADDAAASQRGFTERDIFVAIDVADGRPYAIWEFYSVGGQGPYLSKAIDVDKDHKKLGIGGGMFRAVKTAGFDIVPSGKQTVEGSGLLKSLTRDKII